MDWSVWIIVKFYQLFGLSFWRHPFTAEDPSLNKLCNAFSLLYGLKILVHFYAT